MTGARQIEQCTSAANKICRQFNTLLCSKHFRVEQLTLRNVVLSGRVHHRILIQNLSDYLHKTGEVKKCIYDPTIFPGVRIKFNQYTTTIFASGKFIITGLKTFNIDWKIFKILFEILSKFKK